MPAGALDESRFHAWLARRLGTPMGPLPVGDDTAAMPIGSDRVVLLTSDALVQGYHFLPESPPGAIGAAAASVNLSDIAAKGGRPVAFLLDLLVPPGTPEVWARAVVDGAESQLARFGAHIVGGDTKPSARASVIGTLVGTARRNRLAPRTAALPGDLVVTTGTVGRGGLALLGWDRAKTSKAARDRLLRVRPRVPEGPRLARWAHAMLDTSDGLADSARLLAAASGVRIIVEADRLPIDPGLRRAVPDPAERLRHAFLGGDYELLATVAPESFPAARATLRRLGCPLTEIGSVEAGTGSWLKQDGPRRPMPEGGWRPFRLGHSRRPS